MKKNAFTLIELLAVIVILAIIALIAVPIVINIINDSKDESGKRSVDLYIDAVEKAIIKQNYKTKYDPDECIIQENSKLKCSKDFEEYPLELEIDIKGEKATNGTIEIENGKVVKIKYLTLGNNYYRYDDDKIYKTQKPPKEAGLYDDNYNLLASWDELVGTYNLNITTNYGFNTYKTDQGSFYNVLNNNQKLKSGSILIIKNGISNIGEYTFADCDNFEEIILPDSISYIRQGAFQRCINLESINIPKNLSSIFNFAFRGCKSLNNINLSNNIIDIGAGTFNGCEKLEKIIIPNRINVIWSKTFANCKNLKTVIIPGNVVTIDESAFQGCTSLENIEIMNGLKNIKAYAFSGFTSLKKIKIPNSVTNIRNLAFSGCTGLTNITIPTSVTLIETAAFSGCDNLKSVIFENSSGWYLTDYNNNEHTNIDVTNKELNAINLVTTYRSKYWKREE